MLDVGDTAPEFSGTDQHNRSISLSELVEKSAVVLYFYPKDDTRICTQQACLFRDAYEGLLDRRLTVVGVSIDDADSHRRFSDKFGLPFSLLADPEKTIARAYDVLRAFGLFTKRVTYLIDQDKKIRGIFHHELSARRHLEDIEAAASQIAR